MLFVVKMVSAWDKFLNYIKMLQHRIFGGGMGALKFVTFCFDRYAALFSKKTFPESFVWVINISLILLLYILSFFPFESCFKF